MRPARIAWFLPAIDVFLEEHMHIIPLIALPMLTHDGNVN